MRYYLVKGYQKPTDDYPPRCVVRYIVCSTNEEYEKQLEQATWRCEEFDVKEISYEEYIERIENDKKQREHHALLKYMYLHPVY